MPSTPKFEDPQLDWLDIIRMNHFFGRYGEYFFRSTTGGRTKPIPPTVELTAFGVEFEFEFTCMAHTFKDDGTVQMVLKHSSPDYVFYVAVCSRNGTPTRHWQAAPLAARIMKDAGWNVEAQRFEGQSVGEIIAQLDPSPS